MNLLLRLIFTTLALLILVQLQGCATLNQSECQTADWQIIGLEDGGLGRPVAFLGEHRSACAEYGVSPNLEQYLAGHKQGVTRYCTYQNGVNLGEQGRQFNSVCPEQQNGSFGKGYQLGRELFLVDQRIIQTRGLLKSHWERIDQIEIEIKQKEELLISDRNERNTRRNLINEIKQLAAEDNQIRNEIPYVEDELNGLLEQYEILNAKR